MADQGSIKALTPLTNATKYKVESQTASQSQKKKKLQNLNRNINNSNKNVTGYDGKQSTYANSYIGGSAIKKQTTSTEPLDRKSTFTSSSKGRSNNIQSKTGTTSLERKSTFTSPSTTSINQVNRVGTFVTDGDNVSGLDIPRIDSSSMSQKQVLRTSDNNQEKEANVFIVEGDSAQSDKTIKDPSAKGETINSKTVTNGDKAYTSNADINKDKITEMSETLKDTTTKPEPEPANNTPQQSQDPTIEKSLDINTPFRAPKEVSQKPPVPPAVSATKRDSSPLKHSRSPIPAEPVLHKKSGFTSEHKKKEDMAYSGADIVKQAANAPKQEEQLLADNRVERLTEMMNQMGEKLAAADEENKRLKKENEDLTGEVRQYKDAQQKTNGEIELLKTEWGELTKQLESTKFESEQLKEQLNNKADEDSATVKELTEKRSTLESELIQMRTDLKEMLEARQKENVSHENIVASLNDDIAKKQKEFDEEKRNYEKEIEELKNQIEKLKKECADLRTLKDSVEVENKNLKITIVNLEKEISELNGKIQSLTEQLKQSLQKCQAMEDEQRSLIDKKSELDQTEVELEQALKEKSELKLKVQEQDKLISKLKKDVDSFQELDQTISSLQQQNDKFAKQINNLTEENVFLRNQANEKENELRTLRSKVTELSEKSETGKVALTSMTELIKEKQAHIEDLQKEVKTLTETNSNYLIAMESFSTSNRQKEDVKKSKYEDMESAHKRILDENKRLRTVLAHKSMAETSQESDVAELKNEMAKKERELELAQERIVHLETLLDDVYKAREIHYMQNDYAHEEEAKMSVTSLPEIRNLDSRNSYAQKYLKENSNKGSETRRWATHVGDGHSNNLRQYRHAESYAKRYEHRPNKLKHSGPVTKLK